MERAANKWIENWISTNSREDMEPSLIVSLAREAWEALSPEIKATLMTLSEAEIRTNADILAKLLVTLDSFPAPDYAKEPFRKAIINVKI